MPALFTLANVHMDRPGRNGATQHVLQGASALFADGGITCLVGPSGSGKSTILRLLCRLEDPTAGSIALRGADLRSLDPLILRRRIGYVTQTPVMLPGTVLDNLAAGLRIRGEALKDPDEWLDRMVLRGELLHRPAAELSGGEKQRVALARTLITEPEALLLDEVTASLDADSAAVVERLIAGLGLPAIWVSHDPAQVRRVAACTFRLEAGIIREEAMAV